MSAIDMCGMKRLFYLVGVFLCICTRQADGFHFPAISMEATEFEEDATNSYIHSVFKRSSTTSEHNSSSLSQIAIPPGYSIHDPPPTLAGKGTLVEFAVLIFSVRDIKEINEELSLEMRLQLSWKDARLADWVRYIEPGQKYTVLNTRIMDKLWYPDIFIDYVKSISQPILLSKPASLRFYNDTGLRYSSRITITMSCPMAFNYYPADTQKCNVDMKSYAYNNLLLRLDWRTKSPLMLLKPDLDLPNFSLQLQEPSRTMVQTSAGFYSGIRFTVVLRRSMKFHLIQTYLPSTLFVIVSWLSFLVPPEMVPGRMAICMTTLLTLTAMFSAVRQNIPKVSYIKALDIWMVTCAFFVFLTLVEYTIVLKLRAMRERREKEKALRAAKFAHAVIGQEGGREKMALPDVSMAQLGGNQDGSPSKPKKPFFAGILDHDIEKYTWTVVVALFLLFNVIYWPWLLISSGYFEELGSAQYYSVD